MLNVSKQESLGLFIGDIICFLVALWLMLLIRYGALPTAALYNAHLTPFSILFIVWLIVYFIAGLYEKHTIILKSRLPSVIFNTQIINSIIAIIFFYFIPYFGITPKTNLFIYLAISFILILAWRFYGRELITRRGRQNAILIASGEEMRELREEVNNNTRYSLKFITSIDLDKTQSLDFEDEILNRMYSEHVSVVAIDLKNERIEPILPHLYNLILSGVQFIDMHKVYEDIFDRVPLSLIKYNWFLENISAASTTTYDVLKRFMDIFVAGISGIISLIFYPFIILAIKLDDGGPIFIVQERVGKNGLPIKVYKFRTMTANDNGVYIEGSTTNQVTRVGAFLRRTRLDELPQLFNVLNGDLSLIGPRPELPSLVAKYEKEIPYYGIRHIIKPGLSGWAQLYHENHPHHGVAVEQTKEKLSYDLFYLKNRSFILDVIIALKTIKKILSRSGV